MGSPSKVADVSHDVYIEATRKTAKVRNPWLVLLFTVLTVGIYLCFWWYFVNREMVDLGRSRATPELGDNPGQSTAAYVLGALTIYVPLIWTVITTNQRIRRAQRLTIGLRHRAWLAWLVWIFTFGLGGAFYMQYELNRVWRAPGMRPVAPGAEEPQIAAGDPERLEKLIELHGSGVLSDAEFAYDRARLGL